MKYLGNLLKIKKLIWIDRKEIERRKSKELTYQKSSLLKAFNRVYQTKLQTLRTKTKMKKVEMRLIMKDRPWETTKMRIS